MTAFLIFLITSPIALFIDSVTNFPFQHSDGSQYSVLPGSQSPTISVTVFSCPAFSHLRAWLHLLAIASWLKETEISVPLTANSKMHNYVLWSIVYAVCILFGEEVSFRWNHYFLYVKDITSITTLECNMNNFYFRDSVKTLYLSEALFRILDVLAHSHYTIIISSKAFCSS